ncbi:MAG: carotenoid 1,2-hydratase [Ktedonobacteraceae bacterium]|nr:carotenoid 1,2-hydratase [Ktedonobacteraceae bacterium]
MRRSARRLVWLMGICAILVLVLSSCAFPGVVSTSAQLPQISQTPQPKQFPPIRFPQDEGRHNNLTEWWYYTGHLEAAGTDGQVRRYGFELVVFQVLRSDLPPVYASHFAISDIPRGQFHFDQRRLIEPKSISGDASTKGIDVRVGNWSIQGLDGQDRLIASMQDYAIDLRLSGTKPPVLHNGNGLITYGLGGFSYYYSRTHMNVSGTLTDHGQPLAVRGLAWMDHQWGDFLTLGGGGWDWYSIQLADNTEMMLYFIRDATGKVISTYGGYIDTDGRDYQLPEQAITVSVLDHWTSPATGIAYPSGWRLTVNDQRVRALLTIMPQLKDQELVVLQSTGNTYWEGTVSVEGQLNGSTINGQGYVELTGYHK